MTTKTTLEMEEQKFDVRVIELKMREGELDPKEYEAYLKKLINDEPNAEYIEVYEEPKPEELTPASDPLTFTSA